MTAAYAPSAAQTRDLRRHRECRQFGPRGFTAVDVPEDVEQQLPNHDKTTPKRRERDLSKQRRLPAACREGRQLWSATAPASTGEYLRAEAPRANVIGFQQIDGDHRPRHHPSSQHLTVIEGRHPDDQVGGPDLAQSVVAAQLLQVEYSQIYADSPSATPRSDRRHVGR